MTRSTIRSFTALGAAALLALSVGCAPKVDTRSGWKRSFRKVVASRSRDARSAGPPSASTNTANGRSTASSGLRHCT